jgi:hypothetical protein
MVVTIGVTEDRKRKERTRSKARDQLEQLKAEAKASSSHEETPPLLSSLNLSPRIVVMRDKSAERERTPVPVTTETISEILSNLDTAPDEVSLVPISTELLSVPETDDPVRIVEKSVGDFIDTCTDSPQEDIQKTPVRSPPMIVTRSRSQRKFSDLEFGGTTRQVVLCETPDGTELMTERLTGSRKRKSTIPRAVVRRSPKSEKVDESPVKSKRRVGTPTSSAFKSNLSGTPGCTYSSVSDWRKNSTCCITPEEIASQRHIELESWNVMSDKFHLPLGYKLMAVPNYSPVTKSQQTDTELIEFPIIVEHPTTVLFQSGKIHLPNDTDVVYKDEIYYNTMKPVSETGSRKAEIRSLEAMKLPHQDVGIITHRYPKDMTLKTVPLDAPLPGQSIDTIPPTMSVTEDQEPSGDLIVAEASGSTRSMESIPVPASTKGKGKHSKPTRELPFSDLSYPSGDVFTDQEREALQRKHNDFSLLRPPVHPGKYLRDELKDEVAFIYPSGTAMKTGGKTSFLAYTRKGAHPCLLQVPSHLGNETDVLRVFTDFTPYFPTAHTHDCPESQPDVPIQIFGNYYGPKRDNQ